MKRLVIFILMICTLISCDCYRVVSGTVVDKETKRPIDNILVFRKGDIEYTRAITDSLGNFELADISGGLFSCPPMKIVIEAEGYTKKEDTISAGGYKVIQLEKIKN